ncbi:hypothetical protein [Streptomyces sp. NPDC046853]|uniref:hypothetical protein n=1 Tax=unclassified Streptomyces TaxID=2593676 RepID=UPI00340C09E6
MTSLLRGGAAHVLSSARGRRSVAVIGAVSAGLLVLSACDKPTPLATVTVGKDSVNSDATCYDDGDDIGRAKAAKCALKKASKSISVGQGETLRIGVDPEVAKTGWALWVNGQQVTNPSKKTYYAFEGIDLFAPQQGQPAPDKLYISVVEQDKDGQKFKGVWNFKLKNADA